MVRSLAKAASAVLDVAFPATCAGCGREGDPLCVACRPALDARHALPAGTPIGMPADLPYPLLQLEWCAPFHGAVRAALHELKYAGEQRHARLLGEAVARRWSRAGQGATVVVPVPVHADRERQRGYDQAALIAEVAARSLGMPFVRALERTRATVAQFELGREDRAANVQDAFRLRSDGTRGSQAPAAAEQSVAGRWILLIDDVVTTGATLSACAMTLEAAGARAVSAITVARER